MKITLLTICEVIEKRIPGIRLTPILHEMQIVVNFATRPDVELSLLTPWYQNRLLSSTLCEDDVDELVAELMRLA